MTETRHFAFDVHDFPSHPRFLFVQNASAKAFQNMAGMLKKSSSDSAGYDAVVGGAESLLTGMGQVLNAASSSVKLKPKVTKKNTTVLPTCAPFDFVCKEKIDVQPTNASLPVRGDDDDDEEDEDEEEELEGDAKEVS